MVNGVATASAADRGSGRREEARLAERVAAGDRAALDWMIRTHRRKVAGLAYRLLGWTDEVDDVVQDVFVAALTHAGKFRGDCALGTWLTAITINKCRSRRRSLLRRLRFGWFAERPLPTDCESPAETRADRDDLARVRRIIRTLPAKYREVVVLRYLEEMSVDEIGQVLGVSRNAVEARLSRARTRLRERLAGLMRE